MTNQNTTTTTSDRRYKDGQGYTLVQTIDVCRPLTQAVEHRLRVTVHQGNQPDYAYASVERWDGTQWHPVTRVPGTAMTPGPSYTAWDYTREQQPRARHTIESCHQWLDCEAESILWHARIIID